MSQQMQFQMVSGNTTDQYNDTTFTKLFVGGLAWETQRDTMTRYFEQFGEIVEAVVITDKNTGRSKGYGFVTFKDPVVAMRACQNASPVIDGRRANCNLACLGANKNKPPPSDQHGVGRFRPPPGLVAPPAYHGSSSFFHQPNGQYTFPYSGYGYSGYSQDTLYPTGYYGIYGGQHFSPYYQSNAASGAVGLVHNMYPYYGQYAHTSQAHGFGVQYPQITQLPIMHQQHYGSTGILSFPSSIPLPTITSAVSAAATTTTATTTAISTSKVSEQNSSSQG